MYKCKHHIINFEITNYHIILYYVLKLIIQSKKRSCPIYNGERWSLSIRFLDMIVY